MKKVLSLIMALAMVICMCPVSFVFAASQGGAVGESGDIEVDISKPGSGGGNPIGTQSKPLTVTGETTFPVAAGKTYYIVVKGDNVMSLTISGATGFTVNNTADTQGVYTATVAGTDVVYIIENKTGVEQKYTVELIKYIPGDCNGDGYVNNEDVIHLLWHTLFEEDYLLSCRGDVNGDGDVNNEDVIHLLWHTLFEEDYPLT